MVEVPVPCAVQAQLLGFVEVEPRRIYYVLAPETEDGRFGYQRCTHYEALTGIFRTATGVELSEEQVVCAIPFQRVRIHEPTLQAALDGEVEVGLRYAILAYNTYLRAIDAARHPIDASFELFLPHFPEKFHPDFQAAFHAFVPAAWFELAQRAHEKMLPRDRPGPILK